MSAEEVVQYLNQLLVLHSRSLPVYVSDARPWQSSADQEAGELLEEIAVAHRKAFDQLAEMVVQRGGSPEHGEFPMMFTAYNDLSVDFLVGKMIERGERAIPVIRSIAARLGGDTQAQTYAQELAGEAIGHIESLREVQASKAPKPKIAKLG